MAADRSFAIPVCSNHGTRMQKNDIGQWFCVPCFNEVMQLKGGGSIKDIMVNRRWRRHAR